MITRRKGGPVGPDTLPETHLEAIPPMVDGVAIARLYGEPLFDLPQDLYIPPDALEVFLETFEGPLDLLLYLIRKQNFNVLDIPMAEVTQQYLSYIEQIRRRNLELAGEYLLMAAMLIEIKSRMLLPVQPRDEDGEPEDPRAELVRRLLEYERIKMAARKLEELPQLGKDFFAAGALADLGTAVRLPEVCAEDLREAWEHILKRARLNASHRITREQLSVRDHMGQILRRLQGARFMEFGEFFEEALQQGAGPAVVVVYFIALLELARESLVEITQAEAFAPIYVRLAYTSSAAASDQSLALA